jgi:peptide/nickel transport system substrate-binding protein
VAQPRGPSASSDSSLARVAALLERASLLRLGRDCRYEPALAERVEVSPDARQWRLTLRPGLTFHDGTPIDATSAVIAIQREAGADALAAIPPGLRDVDRVNVVDARTIAISLHAPAALLGEALARLDLRGGASGDSGAGPFTTASTRAGAIELRAFAGYHHGAPAIDHLELRSFDTPRTAWAALLRGEIGFLYEVAPDAVPFVESAPGIQVHRFLRPFVYVTGFNLRHPALRDARVRRALSLAVDRTTLVRRVLHGNGRPAADPVWPLHWAVTLPDERAEVDSAAARRALDAAGLRVNTATPGTAGPRIRLAFTCLVPTGMPLLEGLALAVQRDLLAVGVDMRLEAVSPAVLTRRLAAGAFDAYVLDMNAFGLGWTYWLWHSEASRPFVDAGPAAADGPLERMRRARNDDELRRVLADVQRAFRHDPPALFLCWAEAVRATSRRVAVPLTPDRDVLLSLARWQPSPIAP